MPAQEYADRLKNIRKRLKLSQREFGDVLGYAQGNYSELERGDKNVLLEKVEILCKQFNLNPFYLMYGHPPIFYDNEPEAPKPRVTMRRIKEIIDAKDAATNEDLRTVVNELVDEIISLGEIIDSKDLLIATLRKEAGFN